MVEDKLDFIMKTMAMQRESYLAPGHVVRLSLLDLYQETRAAGFPLIVPKNEGEKEEEQENG